MKTTNEVVIAHDAFTQYGGAERVFEAIHELYPSSPIFTLAKDSRMNVFIDGWNIVTSPLQFMYNVYPKFQHFFPFIPVVLAVWKPIHAKILISASSSFIKGLYKPEGSVHVNYCHTPTRFLWVDPEHAYKEIPRFLHVFARWYFQWLKRWDLRVANKVDFFIANSVEVQKRIKQFYNRESEIITPFVDTQFWKPTTAKKDYFLIAGRLQYAKGLDIVVKTFNEMKLPLHVVGSGRYEHELKAMAGNNITFLGRLSDEQLRDEYSSALGFIYPQFEDFGIMPLEAAACGTPTIGLAKGGSLETIIPGKTGELIQDITIETLVDVVSGWEPQTYEQDTLVMHANRFSKEEFKRKFSNFIKTKVQ